MALDWCKNVFFLNIFRTNGWILIKFVYALIYLRSMLYLMDIIFDQFLTRVKALDWHQNFVYAQYLVNWFVDFNQILYMHWYGQRVHVDLDD